MQQTHSPDQHGAIVYIGVSTVRQASRVLTAWSVAALLLVLTLLALSAPLEAGAAQADAPQRWIVQLQPGANMQRFLGPAERVLGIRPSHVFEHLLRGFAANLTPAQRTALLADPRVLAIQPDLPTRIAADPQPVPPGVSRVGANPSAVRSVDGADPTLEVDIAILDTGVDRSHPDLRVVGGRNCSTTTAGWDTDKHGHGTHVAGIAAARDNGIGVVGVAPGARVWSVKVLNNKGNGYVSWLICGLDWVASRTDPSDASLPRIEVANMSLRMSGSDDRNCGLSSGDLLHQAVCRLERGGVTIVAAAGNDARKAANYVPGAYDEVITVSALADYDGLPGGLGKAPEGCSRQDADDAFAAFSNFGRDVDLIAPGVCVLSTYPGASYALMSGTSMAAPHVAGGAALYYLYEASQGRPRPTPQQVRAALLATGSSAWKTSTDPDKVLEPLLDVSSLEVPPGFEIGVGPATQHRAGGDTALLRVWLARLGGFDEAVDFDVAGYPAGASWSFDGGSFGAAESGSRQLTIALPLAAEGAYRVTINAVSAGHATRSTAATIHMHGGVVGAAGAPRVVLRTNLATKPVALPVKVKWKSVSGAQRYALQVSRDGGAWARVTLPSRTALSVKTTAWPGSIYRYRLRVKKSDVWGPWLLGQPTTVTPNFAGEAVSLSGPWMTYTNANTYSEVPAYARQAGARARLAFTGTSVSWIATRGPRRGKARVFIDGVLVATIDLYASRNQHRRVVFRKSWANQGNHRIVIEVRGTSRRPRVDVDAIVVVRTD